jgi:protein TonB
VKEQEEITNVSTVSQEGVKDEEFVAPPKVEEANTVVESKEPGFLDPSMEAQFNGDWRSYVQRTIERSIDELVDDGVAGTCEVLFVVAEDGAVSDVQALTMKGTVLARIAVDAIKRGPKWRPGKNALGQPVASKRIQKVTFVLPEE